MIKCYSGSFYRIAILVFVMSIFSVLGLQAQTPPYFKGLGTSANTIPMNNTGSHCQQLYLPTDFNTVPISGLITKIYMRNSAAGASGTYTDFSVAFAQNSLTEFPNNTFLTGLTTALSAPTITINGNATAGGWYEIPLTTPFLYNNSQTLIFEIKYTSKTGGMSGYTTTATGNKRLSIITAPGAATGNLSTLWGDFGIEVMPAGPCTNPPAVGTVSSSTTSACIGIPFTLSYSGGTTGSGQTYQWEISTDGTNFTDIPGATNTSLTTSQTANRHYRLRVTCGVSVTTNSILMNTPAAVSGTFTINNLAPASATNFQSFNAAYDYIRCGISAPGVVFNVDPASGPYNEQLIMNAVPGASANATVTFNGNGRTINFNSTVTGQRAVIKLDGADHIKFNNLVITALGTLGTEYGFGVHLTNNADSNLINNCTININTSSTTTQYAGIAVSASHTSATTTGSTLSDGNVFSNNTITGGAYGITLVGSNTEACQNNTIKSNIIKDFYNYGIYVQGTFQTLVDSNMISRPTRTSIAIFNGIYFTGLSVSAHVTRNTISNPNGGAPATTTATHGIFFTGVDALAGLNNKVTNNLLYDFTGNGEMNALNNTSSDNVFYYHNTISLDGAGSGIARAFYQTTQAGGIEFINNIVSISRLGTGAKYALYYNTATSDVNSNRNDLYIAPTATNAFTGYSAATPRATLLDWQTATGDDLNSESTNPIFANPAGGNYTPTNASINNLGIPVGVPIDIIGVTRNATNPDMGAYEFTPGNCIAPPTGGAASVNASPVCTNTPVLLSVSGNSIGLGTTYQWQYSATLAGPYTNLGNPLTNPDTTIITTTTLYYQVLVTCSGNSIPSTPVLVNVNPALPQGTYTINKNAPASATNYVSFNAARDAMLCGIAGSVVFNVVSGSGPYNEQVIFDAIPGTSASRTVTFNGNGETIAFSSSNTNDRAVIKLRGTDHVRFDSLVIDASGSGTNGYGIHLLNGADSNTINNCTIIANVTATTTNYAGIVISASESSATGTGNADCDGNVFSNNRITGGYYSITLVGAATTPVRENQVINNNLKDFYIYGVYLNGNFNTLVEGNEMSRPARTNVSTFYGVYATAVSSSLKISKNRMHNPFDGEPAATSNYYGIYFTGVDANSSQPNIVSNNVVYNPNGLGIWYGLYNTSSSNAHYYFNTIALDNAANNDPSLVYGFYQTTLSDGIILRNNIFSANRGGTGEKYGLFFNTATSIISSNYNNFWIQGTNAFIGGNTAGDYATIAAWRTASGQDANSLVTNPFYTNASAGNLRPLSPTLDNKGIPIAGITTDIVNAIRNATTPDIGAYEFTIPPCTTPPLAGTAGAVPSSGICLGDEINLSLTGYVFGAGQTYQWQFSTTQNGTYTNLGSPLQVPDTTIFATTSLWYRVLVTCGTASNTSEPVQVTINPAFLSGIYTINKNIPASATNFTSFNSAVAALECGITGDVFFDVAPDTYTEQVRMHGIAGTSSDVRVTFRSANGDPTSVNLTFNATAGAANYVLKLDSASYITFKDMTITATNTTNGRVIELANTASFDSIYNCRIVAPVSTLTTTAGIYADLLKGTANEIRGNTITNGSSGIFMEGTAIADLTYNNIIDGNTVNGSYTYNIYVGFSGRAQVTNNIVNVTAPRATTSYGIYSTNSDSAYLYKGNQVNITSTTTTVYGMYFTAATSLPSARGVVANNKILATTGNTGTLYGMYQTTTEYNNNVNNVISINTSGATSYGMYSTGGGGAYYHNNTVVNNSSSATNNVAAYFAQTSGADSSVNIRNNIFAHLNGGRAMYVTNLNFIYSDYNTFYTTGPVLIQFGTGNLYTNLQAWRDTSFWDLNSIAYRPEFISATDPRPNPASPDVWAIHGRGVQIPGNNFDFNNNVRPTTLTSGVPDMGAYEFLPTSLPTLLTATPATPANGITQTFMYGTDTVTKITYAATGPVPASANVRRYSGVLPPGLAPGQQSMYYYTQVEVPAQGAYNYDIKQYYIDPWQGFIPQEAAIKMGRTNSASAWIVNANSTVDPYQNVITDTSNIPYIDKFTGMTDGTVPPAPPIVYPVDSSNRGTRFWVAYGHHYGFSTNNQDMVLYLSAEQAANVTVRVNGTNWVKTYNVGANSVRVSDILPKYGLVDSRITDEGKSDRGISITSDVPIVAYAHIYDGSNSGATMLLPVGVYGYEYQSLNSRQYYPAGGAGSYSWFYVIADRDSTLVEITPAVATKSGRPAGVPFTVLLNRGEVYNVMGTQTGAQGTDLSGSRIRSIANSQGDCKPIAFFSGSSRTAICNTTNGDNMIQQMFPSQAWGTKYATFATANSTSNTLYNSNMFRVLVKDPTTVVKKNNVILDPSTLIVPGNYYEFFTTQGTGPNGAIYVEADKPVMVAQYMVSTGANDCPGVTSTGAGDPEMIYLSPIEQGIKKAVFYSTIESNITANWINVVVPTGGTGLSSLRIDGVSTFTNVFPHPFLPGYTAVRHNLGAVARQHIIESDSAFTAFTYGGGTNESYGYNAGTLVKNLNGVPSITNVLGSGGAADYTCVNAPFRFSVLIPLRPVEILWQLSQVPGLNPGVDSVQTNPVPVDSVLINGRWHYRFVLVQDFRFTSAGVFNVPIRITHPSLEGCSNSQETTLTINVIPAPVVDFTTVTSGCYGAPIQFNGTGSTSNNVPINTWTYTFGDGNGASTQNTVYTYATTGTFNVNLSIVAADGCIGEITHPVTVNAIPAVAVVNDSLVVCGNSPVTFEVQNPEPTTIYQWFTTPTGGTPVFTGPVYTVPNVTGVVEFYVQSTSAASCISERKRVRASVLPDLLAPVATVDSVGTDRIRFRWDPVANAVSYQVSLDNGNTWITPSSGSAGLTHTVTGLLPLTDVTLIVRAFGTVSCQLSTSLAVTGKTLPDDIYIPNAFTPNGDGRNDILLVYGYTIQNMRFMIFNQWGEKIFESNNQSAGWNGTYKGKPQPSGVYMYVCQLTLRDGTTEIKKGSINLVR